MKYSAYFSIFLGAMMLIQWTFFLVTGNVPELQTAPLSIAFHLAAESLTALALILSGILLLKQHNLGKPAFLLAAGMVTYAMINSSGYFAQSGDWLFVGMFGLLLMLTGLSILKVLKQK